MTADLTAAFAESLRRLGCPMPTFTLPRDGGEYEDEETLRRSFGGLSKRARREQRRPRVERAPEEWRDETAVASGEWTGDAA